MKKVITIITVVALMLSCFSFNSLFTTADNVLFGDVNSDGKVDMKDAYLLRKYAVYPETVTINIQNADVRYDGQVSMADFLLLRKYLAGMINTLIPEGYTTTKSQQIYDITNTYTIDNLSDCMYVCGRGVVSGTTMLMDQTASGLKFKAETEGDIGFNVTSSNGGYMDVIVDDDYNNIYRITIKTGTNNYKQVLSLTQGEHTFALLKATEWQRNKFTLNSVTINGSIASTKPEEKDIKLEFYGDSITVGYGNLSNGGSGTWNWNYQDGCMTYASYCSYELNADYAVAGAGGYGVLGGYNNDTDVNDKFFDYSYVSGKLPWSRADFNADVIVINYGTNDYTRDKDNLDTDAFEQKCKTIIEGMHADNPDAPIVWIIGMNYIPDTSKIVASLQKLANEYDYLYFKKFANRQQGGDSHPSVENHKVAGAELADYLKNNFFYK